VHLEILIEDMSGKKALDVLVPKLLDAGDTFRVHSYKGIGHIPKNMKDSEDPSRRILLDNLPKLLKGYGRTFVNYPPTAPAAVVLVCDLDDKPFEVFLGDLMGILDACNPAPNTNFCIAIEEGEAWFLGDAPALKSAYPNAKNEVLASYVQDSICGTWETLADAVYAGGEKALSMKGWQGIGAEKSRWAENISPRMNVEENKSPSFAFFRDTVRTLVNGKQP
jgi:hypothetical protein